MAENETRIRIVDAGDIKETVALGPCIVSQQGPLVEIIFTMPRQDPEVLAGYKVGLPTLVVVARIVLPPDGALELAATINKSAARDKAIAGHIVPDDKGGHA